MAKLFTKNDNGFVCRACGKEVKPLGYSSRNHCPFCLASLHVDINPGDRACECTGIMYPIGVEPSSKGYIITHKCSVCGKVGRNKSADDDSQHLLIKYTNPYNIPDFTEGKRREK
ncbi:MAG: RNHCP domain-containing protein [Clostridia bacterium]|nr:RNHCP domain-containing protein [Clostridia bacterium]